MVGFCENYSTDFLFDFTENDFNQCFEELLLFGLPFLFIFTCGLFHLRQVVQVPKREYYQTEPIELILYLFSVLQILAPILRVSHALWADAYAVGGYEFVSAFFRISAWAFSIILLRNEMERLMYAPSYTLYLFWALSFIGTAFRFRTAIRISEIIEIDFPQVLWFIQFGLTSLVFLIALFMPRHDDTPIVDNVQTLRATLLHGLLFRSHTAEDDADRQRARIRLMTMVGERQQRGYAQLSNRGSIDSTKKSRSKSQYEDLRDVAASDGEDDDEEQFVKPNSERHASLFSILTFNHVTGVLKAGFRNQLKFSDLHDVQYFDRADYYGQQLERAWHEEEERAARKSEASGKKVTPSLIRTMWAVFGGVFCIQGFNKLVSDLLRFVSPQILKLLINFVSEPSQPTWHGYLYTGLLFCAAVSQTIVVHQYFHKGFRIGQWLKSAFVAVIYKKALRMSNSARQSQTSGSILNLMATDSQRIQDLLPFLHMAWTGPIVIIVSMSFLWIEVGPAAFVGVGVMILLLVPMNVKLARIQKVIQRKMMNVKDDRVQVTNEVLASMKVIKLYAWEHEFEDKIMEIRKEEISLLRKYSWLDGIIRGVSVLIPTFVGTTTFVAYTLIADTPLTPEKAFTSLALFAILQVPMRQYPQVINSAIETSVSLERITEFLCQPELKPPRSDFTDLEKGDNAAIIHHGKFYWDSEHEAVALDLIDYKVKRGDLSMIVGQTGSGKSAMLGVLIGDMESDERSRVGVFGEVAYAAQVPWIQNASVRDNILFGSPFRKDFYDKVVFACALEPDMEMLVDGDMTEIGEKGINLSGGQKQRIALARAVYRDVDVYLLDDCLSAVDAHVGAHIMEHCVMGVLKNKTRIFATNSVHFLKHSDHIAVLEEGRMRHQGTYSELVRAGVDLIGMLHVEEHEIDDITPVVSPVSSRKSLSSEEKSNTSDPALAHLHLRRPHSLNGSGKSKPPPPAHPPPDYIRNPWFGFGAIYEPPEDSVGTVSVRGKLIKDEERASGQVTKKIYLAYLKALGGVIALVGLLLPNALRVGADIAQNSWLGIWTTKNLDGRSPDDRFYMDIYLMFTGVVTLLMAIFVYGWVISRIRSARLLHENCLHAILHAPMSFFDTTPIGRILNRFSSDMYTVDARLPWVVFSYIVTTANVIGTILLISVITPLFMIALVPLGVLYGFAQEYYIRTSRELKRWASVLQSPIYSQFSETLDGVSSIRAFRVQDRFIERNHKSIDHFTTAYYAGQLTNRWIAVRLEFVGTIVVAMAALFSVVGRNTLSSGLVGVSITYALRITGALNWMVRMVAERESNVVSVERVEEYSRTAPEAPFYLGDERKHFGRKRKPSLVTDSFAKQLSPRGGADPMRFHSMDDNDRLNGDRLNGDRHRKSKSVNNSDPVSSLERLNSKLSAPFGRFGMSSARAAADSSGESLEDGLLSLRESSERNVDTLAMLPHDEIERSVYLRGAVRGEIDPKWPRAGGIVFDDLQMRYRPDLELVLRGVRCTINPKEKIGIVGRTGSGKSSMFVSLLRVVEASAGAIFIDGVDISTIGLHTLRKSVSIIPQDAVLFTGTIRFNLDPFEQSSTVEMWEALRLAHLDDHVRSLSGEDGKKSGLEYEVTEGGANFSSGQRQLLCLARCLLRKTRILLLDEATSAVDVLTDRLVQSTIREAFADYTVLTIAHRLDTIMDSTRILVMEAGRIHEFDTPLNLLSRSDSKFLSVAESAFGVDSVQTMRQDMLSKLNAQQRLDVPTRPDSTTSFVSSDALEQYEEYDDNRSSPPSSPSLPDSSGSTRSDDSAILHHMERMREQEQASLREEKEEENQSGSSRAHNGEPNMSSGTHDADSMLHLMPTRPADTDSAHLMPSRPADTDDSHLMPSRPADTDGSRLMPSGDADGSRLMPGRPTSTNSSAIGPSTDTHALEAQSIDDLLSPSHDDMASPSLNDLPVPSHDDKSIDDLLSPSHGDLASPSHDDQSIDDLLSPSHADLGSPSLNDLPSSSQNNQSVEDLSVPSQNNQSVDVLPGPSHEGQSIDALLSPSHDDQSIDDLLRPSADLGDFAHIGTGDFDHSPAHEQSIDEMLSPSHDDFSANEGGASQ